MKLMYDAGGRIRDYKSMRTRDNLRSLLRILDIPLAFLLSLLLYYFLAYLAIDKFRIMPIGRERLIAVKDFLDSYGRNTRQKGVFVLGSSILIEGMDCDIIDQLLPSGYESYNFGWTGGHAREWLLVLPSVVEAEPALTVLCIDIRTLFGLMVIPAELLNIANWWDFLSEDELKSFSDILEERELSKFQAPKAKCIWEMRSLLSDALDAHIREYSRPDLRYERYLNNFKTPWVRTKVIGPTAMAKHVEEQKRIVTNLYPKDMLWEPQILDSIIKCLSGEGIRVLIVLVPLNPEVAKPLGEDVKSRVVEMLSNLARKYSVEFVDHSGLLKVEEFADATHASEAGRAVWSRALGKMICAELLTKN
jgi:hypothetical protein